MIDIGKCYCNKIQCKTLQFLKAINIYIFSQIDNWRLPLYFDQKINPILFGGRDNW